MDRRARRAVTRAVAVGAVAGVLVVVLVGLAGPVAGAVGMTAAVLVVFRGACRVLAARDADVAEESWLREVLGGLGAREIEDEDPGVLVY
jgi:hypothetical protein